MVSSQQETGLLLERCEADDGRRFQIDETFTLPEQTSRQMAGFLFSKRLVELGFTPMYTKRNDLVDAGEIRLENFSAYGIFNGVAVTGLDNDVSLGSVRSLSTRRPSGLA